MAVYFRGRHYDRDVETNFNGHRIVKLDRDGTVVIDLTTGWIYDFYVYSIEEAVCYPVARVVRDLGKNKLIRYRNPRYRYLDRRIAYRAVKVADEACRLASRRRA